MTQQQLPQKKSAVNIAFTADIKNYLWITLTSPPQKKPLLNIK